MAGFNFTTSLKNNLLNVSFRQSGSMNKVWIGIKALQWSDGQNLTANVGFTVAANGSINLSSPVNFLVDEKGGIAFPYVINEIWIATTEGGAKFNSSYAIDGLAKIVLTGDDRTVFNDIGAYIISQLKINLLEV